MFQLHVQPFVRNVYVTFYLYGLERRLSFVISRFEVSSLAVVLESYLDTVVFFQKKQVLLLWTTFCNKTSGF